MRTAAIDNTKIATFIHVFIPFLTWDAIMTAMRLLSMRAKSSLPSITRWPPHLTVPRMTQKVTTNGECAYGL